MSRLSLPSTPVRGTTPTLRVPSPSRTPSPLPLFSTSGPYTYTGQIARKYSARFNDINKTKNAIKNAEEAWEKEAQEKGMAVEDLIKTMEKDSSTVWEDHFAPTLGATRIPEDLRKLQGDKEEEVTETGCDKRASVLEEEFVDAPTSPLEKPKGWGDVSVD